jgi:lysylphosphatidylglycerol synthetase-like protein (DUF2156 family)
MVLTRNCLAYSDISRDLQVFEVPDIGCIVFYKSSSGDIYVIGDPLTKESSINTILALFLDAFPRANFIQVSHASANYLSDCGYFVNNFGIETELPLDTWYCRGTKNHMLRKQRKKSEKAGSMIREITDDPTELAIGRKVSDAWLVEHKNTTTELCILTRPPVFEPERCTRKFAAYLDGKMVGIAFFDPLNLADLQEGYVFQLIRSHGGASGVRTHLLLHAADIFRSEEVRTLSLGLSPLCLRTQEPFRHSRFTKSFLHSIRSLSLGYGYEGVEFYKSRFDGTERDVYLCSRSYYPIRSVFTMIKATNMIHTMLQQLPMWKGQASSSLPFTRPPQKTSRANPTLEPQRPPHSPIPVLTPTNSNRSD